MTVRVDSGEGADDKLFYSYGKKSKQQSGGRSSFIQPSISPGPAAYSPLVDSSRQSAPRAGFGTSNREHESQRYISDMHNRTIPAVGNPGPGTYRLAKSEAHSRNPNHSFTPSWKFGTGSQREDPNAYGCAPGPIYCQEKPKSAPAYTFAPMGAMDLGMARSRQDGEKVFLSNAHSMADPTTSADDFPNVGPGLYETTTNMEMMSPKRKGARTVFNKSGRDVQNSLMKEQLLSMPLATTAATTPAAIYQYPSTLGDKANKFGKGPRSYGAGEPAPYISRLHEESMRGFCSPGPGCYDVDGGRGKAVGGLGDGPTYPFGLLFKEGESGAMKVQVPGPGAYSPRDDKTSAVQTGSSYSMAANLRTDFTAQTPKFVPGPGAYDVNHAYKQQGQKTKAPSYSLGAQDAGGRTSFIKTTCTPGPVYSPQNGYVNEGNGQGSGNGKGFSFGGKEKTRNETSTIGIRYHGPLAAQEGLGTEGPGPVYDTAACIVKQSGKREMPHFRIGTSTRDAGPKLFISRLHSAAEGVGRDSPGPGTYDNHHKELADVTSRYRKPSGSVFSTTQRFKSNYSTF